MVCISHSVDIKSLTNPRYAQRLFSVAASCQISTGRWLVRLQFQNLWVPFDSYLELDGYVPRKDKARDTIEVWRTRPDIFFEGIVRRGESTIPSPEIVDQPEEQRRFTLMDNAFKTRTLSLAVCSDHLLNRCRRYWFWQIYRNSLRTWLGQAQRHCLKI